jgi:hypothetical protein
VAADTSPYLIIDCRAFWLVLLVWSFWSRISHTCRTVRRAYERVKGILTKKDDKEKTTSQKSSTTMTILRFLAFFLLWCTTLIESSLAFSVQTRLPIKRQELLNHPSGGCPESVVVSSLSLHAKDEKTSRYEDSDVASKGLVSSLTALVNSFAKREASPETALSGLPPASPEELLERIRRDYTVNNYLWTGNIDLPAFDKKCRFTDPTLSFTGTDQFVRNLQNLRPIVDAVIQQPDDCRSDLLDIQLTPEYVQTRWNMVGELSALPWKPKIDVIGRTKFWYRQSAVLDDDTTTTTEPTTASTADSGKGYRVFFYDEEWEIPAAKALLQLITPAGTIRNSSRATSDL